MKQFNTTVILTVIFAIAYACEPSCSNCDSASEACLACSDGYQLTLLGSCVKDVIPQCRLYLSSNQCARCIPTYLLFNNTCVRDFSGCFQNISSTRCARCSSQLTNIDGTCFGTLNCKQKIEPCSQCQSGFIPSNGKCLASSNNCRIVNSQTGICSQCEQGYQIVGYKCISKTVSSKNCYLYQQNGTCYFCKDGYTLVDRGCLLPNQISKTSVLTISNTGAVSSQNDNAITQQNNQKNSAGGSVPIPQTQSTQANLQAVMNKLNVQCSKFINETCVECYPSYYLNDNKTCVLINPLCLRFNFTTKQCEECYGGYTLTQKYNCIVLPPSVKNQLCLKFNQTVCLQCYDQFHLKDNQCLPNNPLCKEIFANGSCKNCYEGYKIYQTTCTRQSAPSSDPFCIKLSDNVCQLCANGYFVQKTTGICIPNNLNCFENNQEGNCIACLLNFMLFRGKCILPISKCTQYFENSTCAKCQPGFYLTNTICYPKDITCSAYNSEGKCVSCIHTYYLINDTCIFPTFGFDPLCTNYLNSYCTACKNGSYLNNYICTLVSQNCIDFDYKNSICSKCKSGLKPIGPNCI